jgi:tellurite resistance protein TerC
VLLFGIVFALIARTVFILLGAALINTFAWVFYIFGLILLTTAGHMFKPESTDDKSADNIMIRTAKRLFHTTEYYDGDKLFTIRDGKRALTPMLLVMTAIAGTDILFALDSIPAIFGLTQDVFIVFTANAFALLGLRQLYFLIDGLLNRLIYLSYGLAVILAFIGVKLVLHALHENKVPFINGGEPVPVLEVGTGLSLSFIISVLAVTVIASLLSSRGKAQTLLAGARRDASYYLEPGYNADVGERNRIFTRLLEDEQQISQLRPKYRQDPGKEKELLDLIARVRKEHDQNTPGTNQPE